VMLELPEQSLHVVKGSAVIMGDSSRRCLVFETDSSIF
jgi:hypothetical protein